MTVYDLPVDSRAVLTASLEELLVEARTVRDAGGRQLVTFAPKVFVPLRLCRDVCGYCTFAAPLPFTTGILVGSGETRAERFSRVPIVVAGRRVEGVEERATVNGPEGKLVDLRLVFGSEGVDQDRVEIQATTPLSVEIDGVDGDEATAARLVHAVRTLARCNQGCGCQWSSQHHSVRVCLVETVSKVLSRTRRRRRPAACAHSQSRAPA